MTSSVDAGTARAINANELDPYMAAAPGSERELAWLSPRNAPFEVDGLGWYATEGIYRRLPVNPDWPLPEAVDRLADATAGGQLRFRTDSAVLAVKVELAGPPNMNHMPATGQCGVDAYVGEWGAQRYWGTARPVLDSSDYTAIVFDVDASEMRTVTLNLPLYQGVREVLIGVDPGAQVAAPPPFTAPGRIVVYGTSITQGGCATRPGMAWPGIVSRRLGQEVLNLGFSGNGKGEPEVARTLAQLDDVACFVLDYETNVAEAEDLRTTLTDFIPILRERHPETPILVVSKPAFHREAHAERHRQARMARRDIQREIVERHRAAGDRHVHFLDQGDLDIAEGTVDGVHPSDLGFVQLADSIEPALREALAR
ncbi:SGNH/GDSL hydrolase family protein [Propionibacteriaceae bacterium Y2011]